MHALSLVFNSWAQSVPQVYTNDAVQRMYHGLHDGLVEVQDLSYRPYHFYHMMVTFVFAGYWCTHFYDYVLYKFPIDSDIV